MKTLIFIKDILLLLAVAGAIYCIRYDRIQFEAKLEEKQQQIDTLYEENKELIATNTWQQMTIASICKTPPFQTTKTYIKKQRETAKKLTAK